MVAVYIPDMYREGDVDRLIEFMERNSFASVVSVSDGSPVATHLPLTVHRRGGDVFIRGHLARANPQAQLLRGGETMVIFTGPHAYVSPRHYDRWESVPTWNYLAVHAYCEPRLVSDLAETNALLDELIAATEPGYQARWESLPDRFREGMLRGIVGFELRVTRLEGKAKLSQNKSEEERLRIASDLLASERPEERAIGREMLGRLQNERDPA